MNWKLAVCAILVVAGCSAGGAGVEPAALPAVAQLKGMRGVWGAAGVVMPGPSGVEYHPETNSWWLQGAEDRPVWIIVKSQPAEPRDYYLMEINDADGWDGELWSAAADFGRGCWVWRKADRKRPTYEHDLTSLVNPFDDEGCGYIAVVASGPDAHAGVVAFIDFLYN